MKHQAIWGTCFLMMSFALGACSSSPPVKTQAYAKLSDHRTFEYDLRTTWKAIESAFRGNRITQRNPNEVGELEWNKLTERSLETDWIYTQSRDKFVEYKVNGSPRKTYLQTRIKYRVDARRTLGGTDVIVTTQEEVERLKSDGTSEGYDEMEKPDSGRANEILDRINQAILSAPPI